MSSTIVEFNHVLNNIVWGFPAMICILGVGIYLSAKTRFLQFRKMGYSLKTVFGKLFKRGSSGEGATTPFQSLCTALAGTVGTGNIAGVAGAIALGGPGAVFWMWIAALLGMCTKCCEVTMAVHFRQKNSQGDWVGGPMYYIQNGLSKKWHWLAYMYAAFGALTVFGTGNATQVNTIVASVNEALLNFNIISEDALGKSNIIQGIILAVLVVFILIGGIKRIGSVTERLIPFMALLFIALGIGVMIINYKSVPAAFGMIFEGAFNPRAVTGGAIGGMFVALKKGVARGIFSNEAGLGTGSIAHASSDTSEPVNQGLYGIFEVFIDTIVICTLTAMIILCSGIPITYGEGAGAELTIQGFTATYGNWVSGITAVAMVCFAFSTVLGWGLYGARCVEYLFGSKSLKPFTLIYSLFPIVGATANLDVIWGMAETFNGLMAIPNLIALFLLSGVFFKEVKTFFEKYPKYDPMTGATETSGYMLPEDEEA